MATDTAPPKAAKASPAERAAAERLGRVYAFLASVHATPLDKKAIPETKTGLTSGPLLSALSAVYGTDTERARKGPRYKDSYSLYKADYDAVVPKIGSQALWDTFVMLAAEQDALVAFRNRLLTEVGLNDRLHDMVVKVQEATQVFRVVDKPKTRSKGDREIVVQDDRPARLWQVDDAEAARRRLAPAVKAQDYVVLSTLFVHPDGVDMLRAYGEDDKVGRRRALILATSHVQDAIDALRKFGGEVAREDHHWRYPYLLWLAVEELGLSNVPSFKQYVAAIGQVKGANVYEPIVKFVGQAIAAIGLFFTGPVGLVVAGGMGMLVGGAEFGLTFMREREQDLAAQATGFRAEQDRVATPPWYLESALAGAAALLTGLAFFQARAAFREATAAKAAADAELKAAKSAAKAKPGPLPTAPTSGSAGPRAVTPEAKAIGQEAAKITQEAKAVTPEAKAVAPEARAVSPEARPTEAPKERPTTKRDRGTHPSQRGDTPPPLGPRGPAKVLENTAAAARQVLAENEKAVKDVNDLIKALVKDLRSVPANAELARAVEAAHDAMSDPDLIASVAAEVYAEAARLHATPPSALELRLHLTGAQERAVAKLLGLSPETEALFTVVPKSEEGLPKAGKFFQDWAGQGRHFKDMMFDGDHGQLTHMFQDLLVNRAFNAKGVAFNSRSFRVQLGLARTVPDKLYLVDRSYVGIGNKVFAELFDSSFVETLHKPETLYRVLSGELKTLP